MSTEASAQVHQNWLVKNIRSIFNKKIPNLTKSLVSEIFPHDPKNRFDVALLRVAKTPEYRPYCDTRNPYGFYFNRPIIGESTRISGGIFLSSQPAESLVIDEKYNLLRPLVSSFRSRLGGLKTFSIQREFSILEEIFEISNELLEWSPEKINDFNVSNNIGTDTKVALDLYLDQRIGLNRHKVLLAAYIVEKLREDGHLNGFASIPAGLRRASGGDEYMIYTFPNGVFATLDPTPDEISETTDNRLDTEPQKNVA
jgi:hypothetical protein